MVQDLGSITIYLFIYLFVYLFVCLFIMYDVGGWECMSGCICGDNCPESDLLSHRVDPRDGTQAVRLGVEHLCPLNHLASPQALKNVPRGLTMHTSVLALSFCN